MKLYSLNYWGIQLCAYSWIPMPYLIFHLSGLQTWWLSELQSYGSECCSFATNIEGSTIILRQVLNIIGTVSIANWDWKIYHALAIITIHYSLMESAVYLSVPRYIHFISWISNYIPDFKILIYLKMLLMNYCYQVAESNIIISLWWILMKWGESWNYKM